VIIGGSVGGGRLFSQLGDVFGVVADPLDVLDDVHQGQTKGQVKTVFAGDGAQQGVLADLALQLVDLLIFSGNVPGLAVLGAPLEVNVAGQLDEFGALADHLIQFFAEAFAGPLRAKDF
jgi:hypothetical protein